MARVATIRPYDFGHPDKFSKDQLRTLQVVHENMARFLSAGLTRSLRNLPSLGIRLVGVDQMIYEEYTAQLPTTSQLVVMKSAQLAGPFLLDMDLSFLYAAIDRLLGGSGQVPARRDREPTDIEKVLISTKILDVVPDAFNEAWRHLAPDLNLQAGELTYSAALLRVAAPSEVVAVLRFEVKVTGHTSTLAVCYPHASLEPIMTRLAASIWYAQQPSAEWAEDIDGAMRHTPVEVIAELGVVEILAEQLLALQIGDVIRLDERLDHPVMLSVAGAARAMGFPGRLGDHLAIRLVTPFAPVEE